MAHDRMLRAILIVVLLLLLLVLLVIGQGQQIRTDIARYPTRHGSPRQTLQAVDRVSSRIISLEVRIGRVEQRVQELVAQHGRGQ